MAYLSRNFCKALSALILTCGKQAQGAVACVTTAQSSGCHHLTFAVFTSASGLCRSGVKYIIPILKPTDKDIREGTGEYEVILPITGVLAKSEDEALMKATRAVPADYDKCLDRIDIAVRPF